MSGLLESLFDGLPTGAALILEVGDREAFVSRPMVGAPPPVERVTEHLLDGQQRLTALWQSLNDHYGDRTYFVTLTDGEGDPDKSIIRSFARWVRDGRRFPLWADNPREQYQRGLIPLRLVRPGDLGDEIDEWCDAAAAGDVAASRLLERRIRRLREFTAVFNLPFLSLPSTTPPEVAIDVFVKMNTSSVPLTPFDIVVAQVEAATGQALRDFGDELHAAVPTLSSYIEPSELILNVAALRQDRSPTQASAFRLDLTRLVNEWPELQRGVAGAVGFLEEERIFDRERLPTVAVLPILSALWSVVPQSLDAQGNARALLRKFMWRAFFTRRYENSVGSRSLQDYRALLDVLREAGNEDSIPALNEEIHPLPSRTEIKTASWPKLRDTLGRTVLAVSLRSGGVDLADGEPASRAALQKREYHHLFPDALLTQDGGLGTSESFRALNCALITWNTNRNISAKEPIAYLKERALRSVLGEGEVRSRVESHCVPFDALNVGGYAVIGDGNERRDRIQADYDRFLDARAEMVERAMTALCRGEAWRG